MGKWYISYLQFDEIAELFQKYSRSKAKTRKRDENSKVTKSTTGSITRVELGNFFEDFKIDLLSTLGTKVYILKTRKKQEEQNQALSIFCLKCRKKIHWKNVL